MNSLLLSCCRRIQPGKLLPEISSVACFRNYGVSMPFRNSIDFVNNRNRRIVFNVSACT